MSFTKVPYDESKLEATRLRLENHARTGDPIYYSVVVDDIEIIPKTSDPSLFNSMQDLIGPATQYVQVSEYIGNTRNRKTTCYFFDTRSNSGTLQGLGEGMASIPIEEKIRMQVDYASLKKDYDRVVRENQTKQQHIDRLLARCNALEDEKNKVLDQNVEMKQIADENGKKDIIGMAIDKVLDRVFPNEEKPKVQEEPLSGSPEGKGKQQQGDEDDNQDPTDYAISAQEYENYQTFLELFRNFNQAQRGLVSVIISNLSQHPSRIDRILMLSMQDDKNDNQQNIHNDGNQEN